MRFAYADPPYIGQARKLYACSEIDHAALVERLLAEYPDGWPTLGMVLRLCPPDVRVGAWVKPFASFKPGVNPAYAWEPVVFRGGRTKRARSEPTVRDWVSVSITLKKGLTGAKPRAFAEWIVEFLGAQPGDTIDDLFPGTGACGVVFTQRTEVSA